MANGVGRVVAILGLIVAAVGVVFQIAGAAAVVYCSVVGAGIVLFVVGAATWLIQDLRHRGPTSQAA